MTYPPLAEVLETHGLTGATEEPLPNDGWSGARMTRLQRRDGARFVLKRDSLALDWIARETDDVPELREAALAHAQPKLPGPVRLPHLGVGRDGDLVGLLMPDLTGTLLRWESPVTEAAMDGVLGALAALHRDPWQKQLSTSFPWTDLRRRVLLLTPRSATTYESKGNPVGRRFIDGWAAFRQHAPPEARELIDRLTDDPEPVFSALARLPAVGLHGDLKLGNAGLAADDTVWLIDWQMTLVAPIAVELGWFLVCNVAGLPALPDEVLERYRRASGHAADEAWATQRDLALVVGLLLRGWRKGLDVDAGLVTACGWSAAEDLAWWGREAAAAARRRL